MSRVRIPRVSQLISLKLSDNKGLRLIYFCKSVCIAEEDKNGEKYYIFKGDNNDEEDPKPIHRKRIKFKIRDKWVYIRPPYRGDIGVIYSLF